MPRVLVVDDNHDGADTLAMLLRAWGFDVRVVYNGQEALDALIEYRPDCVLSDLGLPGIDGYRLAEMIRQDESFRGIRLIALSAYNEPEKAQSAGFDRHLLKPANPDLLQSTLRMLLMLDKRLDRAEKLIDKQGEIVAEARNFIQEVKADVKEIKGDLREVKQDVQEIKEELRENREKGEG